MKWTDEQHRSITTTGTSLLVSAAAGSGKTAVLAERCAYLVCDAPQKCEVDELLVVTFTKAAAAEMRSRIEQALRRRMQEREDPRLEKQLMLIERAQINTLHVFCQSVLRRHFHRLGLDPNFRILDEEEIGLLKLDTARALFDHLYETDSAGEFQKLIDLYGNGDDSGILRRVISLHELMGSVVDPQGWLTRAASDLSEAQNAKPLIQSRLGKDLAASIRSWMEDLRGRWVNLATLVLHTEGFDQYHNYITEQIAALDSWRSTFRDGNFDALAKEVAQFESGNLPRMYDPPPEKERFQKAIRRIRDDMKEGALVAFCRFSEQEWRDGLAAIATPTRVFVEVVRQFERRFSAAKRELRALDFTDLERFTLRILREKCERHDLTPSSIARAYQREFRHVLVDEYQDINEVQDAILQLVSGESGRSPVNLFCVGDVKQSIYRFRLAQPAQFLARYTQFKSGVAPAPVEKKLRGKSSASSQYLLFGAPNDVPSSSTAGQVIDLSSNFRSRGPLIHAINNVFQRLMRKEAVDIEYDESHQLRVGLEYPSDKRTNAFAGSPIELHLLPAPPRVTEESADAAEQDFDLDRSEREAAFVAKRITELMSEKRQVIEKQPDGSLAYRPLRYRDIVILLRSMKFKSRQFADILHGAGIPVHSDSGSGFFESMEIRDMRALLQLLDNQQQDVPMAAALRSPLSGLPHPDDCLARIRLAYPDFNAVGFHQAVVKYSTEQRDELAAQLKGFLRDLLQWRRLAHQRPLAEVLWQIYDSTGYLAFCAGLADGEQRVANLIEFHERARQFGSFQKQGLSRFMQFLDSLAEESDLGQPSIASEADDVVRVMSIHRSKGLEFPVVFIPDLGKSHNLSDTYSSILVDRDAGIGLMVADETLRVRYPSLAHVLIQQRIRKQTLAEEMRVLYVAMTRAREHLILVGTCDETVPQTWKEQWSQHVGALPPERILGARTMLDWIGPAAAAIEGSAETHRIDIAWHPEEEVPQWSSATTNRPEMSEEFQKLARLDPLDSPPPVDEQADRVRQRLTSAYPYEPFTRTEAVKSVGALTKHGQPLPGSRGPDRRRDEPFEIELPGLRCMLTEQKVSATDAGSATHTVLEHLDFSAACERADIESQIRELVRRKLLAPALADAVDVGSIVWMMSTPLGTMLRRNNDALQREVPIHYSLAFTEGASPAEPRDFVMVRGRIDLLIPDASGLTIVDFKTDNVNANTVDARAEYYTPQLESYRDAIQEIAGQHVRSSLLVFLSARVIREI